jgi:hypothetical protein
MTYFLGQFAFPMIWNLANRGLEKNLLQTKQQIVWILGVKMVERSNALSVYFQDISTGRTTVRNHLQRCKTEAQEKNSLIDFCGPLGSIPIIVCVQTSTLEAGSHRFIKIAWGDGKPKREAVQIAILMCVSNLPFEVLPVFNVINIVHISNKDLQVKEKKIYSMSFRLNTIPPEYTGLYNLMYIRPLGYLAHSLVTHFFVLKI